MLSKSRGIILRNTNFRESSIISKVYTREFGLRTYLLQSVRKGKSAIKPSMIQPLSLVDMEVYEKSNNAMSRVKELKNVPLLLSIQDSIAKSSIAIFLLEIINQCISEEQFEHELFDFLESEILKLENDALNPLFPLTFLLKLSNYLGVSPQGTYTAQTPYLSLIEGVYVADVGVHSLTEESSALISRIVQEDIVSEQVSGPIRRQALSDLVKYFQIHVTKEKKIKSIDILSDLLS